MQLGCIFSIRLLQRCSRHRCGCSLGGAGSTAAPVPGPSCLQLAAGVTALVGFAVLGGFYYYGNYYSDNTGYYIAGWLVLAASCVTTVCAIAVLAFQVSGWGKQSLGARAACDCSNVAAGFKQGAAACRCRPRAGPHTLEIRRPPAAAARRHAETDTAGLARTRRSALPSAASACCGAF